jgi:dTDP-4-dehydrorhamnose reductase
MILIFGSNGLFGSFFKKFLKKKKIKFLTVGRKNSDFNGNILEYNFLSKVIKIIRPKIIINFAAYTNVENCETNEKLAYKLNVDLPANISHLISSKSYFIHFSTDHIYSGRGPHKENKVNKLLNTYAKTKFLGEKNIKHKNSCILRTNFFGKSIVKDRSSFTDWIHEKAKKNNKFKLFNDVYFSPLSMNSLSNYLLMILKKQIKGVYNLGSNKGMSKKDFVLNFSKNLRSTEIEYNSISLCDSLLKVKRPKDMRMDCGKIEKKLGIKLNNLIDEINLTAKNYKI